MSDFSDVWCVVPAAGMGTRIGAKVPKQYLALGQTTILELTLKKLIASGVFTKIIVALAPDDNLFEDLAIATHPLITRVVGGETRADSVLAGLDYLNDRARPTDWVMVHDAARPFVLVDDIVRLLQLCRAHSEGAILAVPVTDTLKISSDNHFVARTLARDGVWQAQTPQCFSVGELYRALQTCCTQMLGVTDEASAIELTGGACRLLLGRADNIKITRPEDLPIAAFIAQQQGIS